MDFKDKVKYARKSLKLTQAELAKELNVDFSTINKWENGVYQPQFKKELSFYQYCKTKGIDFYDLSMLTEKLTELNLKLTVLEDEKGLVESQIKAVLEEIINLLKAKVV